MYTPEQNVLAENINGEIADAFQPVFYQSNVPVCTWKFVVTHEIFIKRTIKDSVTEQLPFKLVTSIYLKLKNVCDSWYVLYLFKLKEKKKFDTRAIDGNWWKLMECCVCIDWWWMKMTYTLYCVCVLKIKPFQLFGAAIEFKTWAAISNWLDRHRIGLDGDVSKSRASLFLRIFWNKNHV